MLPYTRMAYKEPKKRSIRLDDDVYEALRKLPESPNKFLRKLLSAGGAFELPQLSDVAPEGLMISTGLQGMHVRAGKRGETGTPILRMRPHTVHSGVRPVAGCKECEEMVK